MKSETKKLMLCLVANTVLMIALYFAIPALTRFPYMPQVYLVAGAGLGIYYVIYNRGFAGKGITPEQLPETMSLAEKQKFIEDSQARLHKSRWVLTLLVPILFTYMIDMLYLFVFPYFASLFA